MAEKLKVLHIIKSLGRGGAETLLPETLKLHDQSRFEFHYIFFLPWKDQMVNAIETNGGVVRCVPASNNASILLQVHRVQRYIRENHIQLVHCHLPWAGILARLVGRRISIPVIYTEHNKQERYHIGTRVLNLLTMGLLRTVIAVSADVAESIYRHKPGLKVPIKIILNGVNIEHFDKQRFDSRLIREKFNIPTEAPVVGTIAVFRFQKRLDLWIELAAKILQQHDNAHFIIVGDGPLKNELMKKREALGLQHRVHMPGLETEVRPYLAAFDIFMMCSVFEGLPIALLEAMAMECPVISTDAGGIGEVVRHGVEGLICAVEQPEKLVEHAHHLLKEPEISVRYGIQARKRVVEEFSMLKMVHELEGVYREVGGIEE
jgi:glycosyltransferase involved in cell wall biosynthesis